MTQFDSLPQRRYLTVLWFTLLTALGGVWAYYRVFTGFSIWDDEGSLMLSVKQYIDGLKLYDQVWSGYGPVYYFYNWIVRSITATPVTHDVVRISSLLPWLATSLVCAWIVLKFTKSLVLASFAQLLTTYSLQFFANEPGHPQEICILLLLCLIASGQLAVGRTGVLGKILLGVLPATLLLIKVNLGIFAIVAVSLALGSHVTQSKLSKVFSTCLLAASVFLPLALMRHEMSDPAARVYCCLVTAGIIGMGLAMLDTERIVEFDGKKVAIVIVSFLLAFAVIVSVVLAQGSSVHAMLYSLLLLHLRVSVMGLWYIPISLTAVWIPWALCGPTVAGLLALSSRRGNDRIFELLFPLKLIIGIGVLAAIPSYNGAHLFALAEPFCWLALYPAGKEDNSRLVFPRTLLCTVVTVQALYAYPVAESQLGFVKVLLIVMAVILIGDFFLWFDLKYPTRVRQKRLADLFAIGLLLIVVLAYLRLSYTQRSRYQILPSLNLKGARRIHLPATQARIYKWLAGNAIQYCDMLVGLPNIPSLNLWTGIEPPARMNSDAWILVLTDKEQADIVLALSRQPKACAIYSPEVLAIWDRNNRDLGGLPLVRYIRENFKPLGSMDNYVFLVTKQRDLRQISAN